MVERGCCTFATYIPLVFVYSLTTWGVWVLVEIGKYSTKSSWVGKLSPWPKIHVQRQLTSSTRNDFVYNISNVLYFAQLVVHNRCLYEPRLYHEPRWLRPPPYAKRPEGDLVHRQEQWRDPILQEVSGKEAGSRSSLLDVQALRPKDGPPLPLARHLHRPAQPEGVPALLNIYNPLLPLRLCC